MRSSVAYTGCYDNISVNHGGLQGCISRLNAYKVSKDVKREPSPNEEGDSGALPYRTDCGEGVQCPDLAARRSSTEGVV